MKKKCTYLNDACVDEDVITSETAQCQNGQEVGAISRQSRLLKRAYHTEGKDAPDCHQIIKCRVSRKFALG